MANPVGIGIEIGEDEIRVVKLHRSARGAVLQSAGSFPTPPGAVSGGTVTDPRLLAEGLRGAFRRYEIRGGEAVVGLPGRASASRVLELPVMAREEMTAVVAGEMEHYRMIPMNQGTFDFIVLGEATEDTRRLPILVIAADKKVVDSYREALRLAGMQMAALEPLSLAASRALFPVLERGGTALLTVGARAGELAVFHNGALRYSRQIDVGALEIAEENPADPDAVGQFELETDKGPELPRLERAGGNRQSLVYEIQRSLGFYHREAPNAERVDRMIVCVDTERVHDLKPFLESSLGLPVAFGEPFKDMLYSDERFNPELLARTGPAYGPAVGLALRMLEETPRVPRLDLSITGVESRMAKVAPRWLVGALTGSVVLVLAVLIGMLVVDRTVRARQVELGRAKQELARVSKEEQERTSAAKRAQEAQSIVQLRGLPWSDILFQVSESIPDKVWLTSLGFDSGNALSLEGVAFSATSVASLMESLTRSALFSGPQMSSITKESSTGRQLVRYQVKVVLTPPVQSAQPTMQPATATARSIAAGGMQ
jgi:type IV pilus assembly protein PilM